MGFLYQKIDESDNALKYFNEALNIERSDQIDKATVYDNIGLLYYTKGDYHIAVEYLSKAVKLAQDDSSLPRFKEHYDVVNQHLLSKNKSLDKKLNGSI
jgi:tetratricopeptide (TPR) repeat protein